VRRSKDTRRIAGPLTEQETEQLKAVADAEGSYTAKDFETCRTLVEKGLVAFRSWNRVYMLTDAGYSRLEAIMEGEHAPHS
jgi:hypothetical protein